jgi:Flp pilus assembly protein TadD
MASAVRGGNQQKKHVEKTRARSELEELVKDKKSPEQTFDGNKKDASQVQGSAGRVTAEDIARQENEKERARQKEASKKAHLDKGLPETQQPKSNVPQDPRLVEDVFKRVGEALEKGHGGLTEETRKNLIYSLGRVTGTNEGLAQLALNPSLGMNAELSAGYRPSGWLVMPSMQLQTERGEAASAVTLKPGGRFENLISFQMKFKADSEKPSLVATFTVGGHDRFLNQDHTQVQFSVEVQYKNKSDYLNALGFDARNLPGTRTALWLTDQVIQSKAPSASESAGSAAKNSTIMRAVSDELGRLLPPMLEAIPKFESMDLGWGGAMSFDSKEVSGYGVKAAGVLKVSYMHHQRLVLGQKFGQGVQYDETSIGVGLGAKSQQHSESLLSPQAEGEFIAGFTKSSDPERKNAAVDPSRVDFANRVLDGRFADSESMMMEMMKPVIHADQIQRVVTALTSPSEKDNPNGVKMWIDDGILAKALEEESLESGARLLDDLSNRLSAAVSADARREIVASFTNDLKLRFKSTKQLQKVANLSVVSLKTLVSRAEKYASNWDQLPSELRTFGITRLLGYINDPSNDDVLIVGSSDKGSPPIELDDLIVGVRSVWRDGSTPLVSLDPDPDNLFGPQHVRIQGIPRQSQFAKTMLEADYLMKKILFGVEPVSSPGFVNLKQILTRGFVKPVFNRFWLYPIQPQTGDIQISSDGNSAFFISGVQVLSEEMLRTREGLIGSGHTLGLAEEAAANFTHHYQQIGTQAGIYKKLHGLFDIVLLSHVWKYTKINSSLLNRLVALPNREVTVPESYQGVSVKSYTSDRGDGFVLGGGVQAKVGAGPHTWLVIDDAETAALRQRSRALSASNELSVSYSGLSLNLPEPDSAHRDTSSLALTTSVAKLQAGDGNGAYHEIMKMMRAYPDDPEPLAFRAFINFCRNDLKNARGDAVMAREREPNNPSITMLTSLVLYQCDSMEGDADAALREIDLAIKKDPQSVNSRILRGTALAALGKLAEARAEFKQAVEADPTSALACLNLGLVETADGWGVKGARLINKARGLAKLDQDTVPVKVGLALAELTTAALGNAEEHLLSAKNYAQEALKDPVCNPASALSSLHVLSAVAMIHSDWKSVNDYVERAKKLAPYSSDFLVHVAESAHDQKRDDIAQRYLLEAEKITPNSTTIKALREKLPK